MGYDTGIAARIRAKGVTVVEVDGWRTRGGATHDSILALMHHTAGSANGATPSLAICIFGRGGSNPVPGPLVQVLQSREPDGDDKAYVIAAGKANHAGVGVWRGVSGNTHAAGVEVEHTGVGGVPAGRREITCRILAALLEGGSRDWRNACQHAEFATPQGRKVDFTDLAPDTPASIRARVAHWIGRTAGEDDDMSAETVAEGVELAVKAGGRARDDLVTLTIGSLVTGLRKPREGTKPKTGEGDLREPFKQLLREVMAEGATEGVLLEADPIDGAALVAALREAIQREGGLGPALGQPAG